MPGDMLLSMEVFPTVYAVRGFQLLGRGWGTHDGEDTPPRYSRMVKICEMEI